MKAWVFFSISVWWRWKLGFFFFNICLNHYFFKNFYYDVFIIQEGIHSGNSVRLILYISYVAPTICLPAPSLPPLEAIARGFLVLFHLSIWSLSTIYYHLNLLPSPSLPLVPPTLYLFHSTVFHCYYLSWCSKGCLNVSHCGCALLWSIQPLPLLSLTLYLSPPIFQQLSIHMLISSTFTSYVLWYYWCSIILFSLPSFPKSNRAVLLLQTCSPSEIAYGHACFCVYVYLLDLPSTCERKHVAFVFLSLAYFT
jgi:hypothetical protein